ncbi:secretion-regulating guanine nucleotide exchange factor-like [Lampetra planeri]
MDVFAREPTAMGSWDRDMRRTRQPLRSVPPRLHRTGLSGLSVAAGDILWLSPLGVGKSITHSADLLVVELLFSSSGCCHSGCVYQWGTGLCSLAKRALSPRPVPSYLSSKVPSPVPGLDRKASRIVTAGSAHCVCLTEEGDLFLWGSNKHGQLTTTEPFLSSPTPLQRSLLGGEKVLQVWSGWTHIVAQTVSGRVFSWGRGDYGQLGRPLSPTHTESTEQLSAAPSGAGGSRISPPAEIKALCGATQIACGSEHNLAILGGSLLSWGWNEHGMCGDGSQSDASEPQLVAGLRPVLIGCGAGHSMAVCAATTGEDKDRTLL